MSEIDLNTEAVRLLKCPYCWEPRWFACTTKSGEAARYPHAARRDLLEQVWMDGHSAGERDAEELAERRAQRERNQR